MKILTTIQELKEFVKPLKKESKTIGFVPTMGALHEGHITLGKRAKQKSDVVIYSIFVNPTQFGPNEDLDKYPRTFEADQDRLKDIGVDAIFYPTKEIMYPKSYKTFVKVEELSSILCGSSRINHFQGVTTVVLKLFNLVECDKAFFGLKDFQQFTIIKQMANDLNLNVELFGVEIVRENDGLAMSSRNRYLSPIHRQQATVLSKALFECKNRFKQFTNREEVIRHAKEIINSASEANIEYIELKNSADLSEANDLKEKVVMLLAVKFGTTRLIDNLILN